MPVFVANRSIQSQLFFAQWAPPPAANQPRPTLPLSPAADFLLINWCSVQRIMRRCNVLAPERIEMLDELGFDWSGADPLS